MGFFHNYSNYTDLVLEAILAAVGDAILVVNKNGIIQRVNCPGETLFGRKATDIVGKSLTDVFTLENKKGDPVVALVHPFHVAMTKKIATTSAPFILVRNDTAKVPIALSASPIIRKVPDEPFGVVLAFRDKTREEEVRVMKKEFVPFAAHQLRTPLGSMRWNEEMLLSGRLGRIPMPLIDTIRNIYDSTQQVIRLVNDLLNLSRIDEGRIPNDPEEVDVAKVIQSVARELAVLADKRAVSIQLILSENIPKLYIDASRFGDVVQNVVSNAVKFNAIGGKVTVQARRIGDMIEIRVADTGMGIPKEEQKKVFEKFFRAENAVASQVEGTGLGLYVVKYYVEEWGGTVRIESEERKGTTVVLAIPALGKLQ